MFTSKFYLFILVTTILLIFSAWVYHFRNPKKDMDNCCNNTVINHDSSKTGKFKGVSFVAPPRPFKSNPMLELKKYNIEWISVIPYAFSAPGKPFVKYGQFNWQWWGESKEGVSKTIQLAHENKIKVMLKPQVYIPGAWTGAMNFESEDSWILWENQYRTYIMDMARMASEHDVEVFCLGTEFNVATFKRRAYWNQLIDSIQHIYKGRITYSANWDDYHNIPFWSKMDYIGISAYFPLTEDKTPSIEILNEKWNVYYTSLQKFSDSIKKPILFTEFGYLTVDGTAGKTWELEKQIEKLNINQQAQANAYEALFHKFWNSDFWAGGFVWKWFPEGEGHEGYPDKDYTPQNKQAGKIMKNWYSK